MGKITGFKEFKRVDHKARPVKERVKDFKEIYQELPKDKLMEQASRCMNCGTPFCNWGCPLGNLMPDWNDMIYKGEWEKAYNRLILTTNFPEFTGRICPALCESSCTLSVNRDAVSIRQIEMNIIEKAFENGWVKPNIPKVRTNINIAVIGSGPSGLAAAAQLNSVGHSVTVFEKADEVGGLLRYGIPDFKLDKSILNRRIKLMEDEGVKFVKNTEVGKDYSIEDLKKDFSAIILTCGSTVPRDLKVEGRELNGIHFAVDYLSQQNKKNASKTIKEQEINAKDKVVVVIGGGDTGSDCIGTAVRQGAKKIYQYEIMPKPPVERDDTMPWPTFQRTLKTTTSHEEGCERQWCISTKKITGKNGSIDTLHGAKVQWEKDDNGRLIPKEIEGSEFQQKVDLVFVAMGFLHPKHDGLINDLGVALDERGNIKTDDTFMTTKQGIFAAGDARRGQSLVVWAINEGRQAAKAVDKYLMGETSLN
ncbi:MAG: gltD [Clostridiaceae bacterium]|nr:gltD [Clostridiaceae bacterium]